MVIHYLANARLPTEKAHGLQIVQNCEALAAAGADVTLVVPRRYNPAFRDADPWMHYGVARRFAIERVVCLDLFPLGRWCEPVAAIGVLVSFTVAALVRSWRRPADVVYSRDAVPLLAFSLWMPATSLVYEAHQASASRIGQWIQRMCLRRVGTAFAVTSHLASHLEQVSGRQVAVLRDGFRQARFANLPAADAARHAAGLAADAFLVGYVGRLETMAMSKGLDLVVDAIARLDDPAIGLCLVGGPADRAEALRDRWRQHGLTPDRLSIVGEVPAADVPRYLAAFDVCVLPLPFTPHFAYCASPLKLFEYMAAGRAIIASNLPSTTEVLADAETGVLVPAGDVAAFAEAVARLRRDEVARQAMGDRARCAVLAFSWDARARLILEAVQRARPAGPAAGGPSSTRT